MKKVFFIGLFSVGVLASCADSKKEPSTEETVTTTATPETANNAAANTTTTAASTTANSAATPAGMNPPHGQPGHRCDIPVGAPLDSKPSQNIPTQAAPQQPANNGQGFLSSGGTQQQAAPAAAPSRPAQQTAPGMKGKPNPAHGQPGHRCDVQVGQPLP